MRETKLSKEAQDDASSNNNIGGGVV